MKEYFIGIDTAQVNCGLTIMDESMKIELCIDTGQKIPKECKGKDVPDFVKNAYQSRTIEGILDDYASKGKIRFVVLEGPDYGASSNVTQISIGSIHGVLQDMMMRKQLSFAVVTPKSIQYFIHGTAKNINKRMTMNKVKEVYSIPLRNSNMADSVVMASVAFKFYHVLKDNSYKLESYEAEVLTSKRKLDGVPKGLIFKRGIKYEVFNENVSIPS